MLSLLSAILPGLTLAHNWVASPSRSAAASTVQPCNRAAPWPHIQVGPGQSFAQEWMTGHEGTWTYLLVLHESDAYRLSSLQFSDLDRYLDEAPHNMAQDPEWKRFHISRHDKDHTENIGVGKEFIREVPEVLRPEIWINESIQFPCVRQINSIDSPCEMPKGYEYSEERLSEDKRAKYQHPDADLAWIEEAAYYAHNIHEPSEFDTTNFTIQGRKGPGRYILHYKWRSYSDCVDIDLLDTSAQDIYGQFAKDRFSSPVKTYLRVDHCTTPKDALLMGPCRQTLSLPYTSIEECHRFGTNCDVIVMAPAHYPSQVRFPDRAHYFPLGANNTDMTFAPGGAIVGFFAHAGFICPEDASIFQAMPTGTRISWAAQLAENPLIISTDPRDPAYYHTCWVKAAPRSHNNSVAPPPVANDPPSWKNMDRCTSCRDAVISQLPFVSPPAEDDPAFCRKCTDIENFKIDLASTDALTDIWYQADTLYSRIGLAKQQCKPKEGCPAGFSCKKRLGTDLLGHHDSTSIHDCMKLVLKDPECAGVAISETLGGENDAFREPEAIRQAVANGWVRHDEVNNPYYKRQTGQQCYCWKRTSCCGECEVEDIIPATPQNAGGVPCNWNQVSGPWKRGTTWSYEPPEGCYPKFSRVFFHNETASYEYRQSVRSVDYRFSNWLKFAKLYEGAATPDMFPLVLD